MGNEIQVRQGIICMPTKYSKPWPKKYASKKELKKAKRPVQQCIVFGVDPKSGKFTKPKIKRIGPIIKNIAKPKEGKEYIVDNNIPKVKHWVRLGTRGTYADNTMGRNFLVRIPDFYEVTQYYDLHAETSPADKKDGNGIVKVKGKNLMGYNIFNVEWSVLKDLKGSPINEIETKGMSFAIKMFDEAGKSAKSDLKNAVIRYYMQVATNLLGTAAKAPDLSKVK
ncbi:hypothetical protein ACFL52_04325 [Candidatus Margulisiibacteriota bacterium]